MRGFGVCKCGSSQWFGSMPPEPCAVCYKCGTGPHGEQPKPHDFVAKMVETDEGDKPQSRCRWCTYTPKQIEKRKAHYGDVTNATETRK